MVFLLFLRFHYLHYGYYISQSKISYLFKKPKEKTNKQQQQPTITSN